jgi:hypothetical protein
MYESNLRTVSESFSTWNLWEAFLTNIQIFTFKREFDCLNLKRDRA